MRWTLAVALLAAAVPLWAEEQDPPAVSPAGDSYQRWLDDVQPLISPREREVFLALTEDYRREAFINEFWRVRDPFPETSRNELRERWEGRLEEARQKYDGEGDERARMYAVFGPPLSVIPGRCSGILEPLEIWYYRGSGRLRGDFWLVFQQRGSRYILWSPSGGLREIAVGLTGSALADGGLLRQVADQCFRGPEVATALAGAADYERLRSSGQLFPDPGFEWVQTVLSRSTDIPSEGEAFEAEFSVQFPGRYQSRTVLQGVIVVPPDNIGPSDTARYPSYDLVVDGEILRKDALFERFRYKFHFPQQDVAGEIPLLFQRYLRPGVYELVVRAQDLGSGRFFRHRQSLEVPFVASAARAETRPAPVDVASAIPDRAAEANASLSDGDWSVRLLPPPIGLQVGNTRVEAITAGEGIARVRFALNDRPVMTKSRPPYSVEINLGEGPRIHRVAAIALDAEGRELARDEIEINAGPHRFAIRLIEPQRGKTYESSLRALAEVEIPEGDRLDRVELFLNDTPVATLFQPPFAHPILLPPKSEVAYVRAVAYLSDGNSAEDLIFVNAPEHLDEIEVRYVELFTTVLDRRGRPVGGLTKDNFKVFEEGDEQPVRRFERVVDLPIYAGILLDNSSSMVEELDEATKAALKFFETVLTPKDRAAVMTFNHVSELVVRFTNNPEVLAGGVAGIVAEGGTALYDSLIYALYYFSGIQGKRAIILLSDGDDQASEYRFDDALDYARRSGVSIYTIGLGLPSGNVQIRSKLQRLADETGGRSFFVERASGLGKVYAAIEEELRTQYLLTYQAPEGDDKRFRRISVEVDQPGAEAKTLRGYYP
ncbi:MAG: VWA domain-containing protein [Acidobacteriota bacterium]